MELHCKEFIINILHMFQHSTLLSFFSFSVTDIIFYNINIEHKQLAILHHQYLLLQLIQFWEIPNKSIRCHILYSILEIDPKVK